MASQNFGSDTQDDEDFGMKSGLAPEMTATAPVNQGTLTIGGDFGGRMPSDSIVPGASDPGAMGGSTPVPVNGRAGSVPLAEQLRAGTWAPTPRPAARAQTTGPYVPGSGMVSNPNTMLDNRIAGTYAASIRASGMPGKAIPTGTMSTMRVVTPDGVVHERQAQQYEDAPETIQARKDAYIEGKNIRASGLTVPGYDAMIADARKDAAAAQDAHALTQSKIAENYGKAMAPIVEQQVSTDKRKAAEYIADKGLEKQGKANEGQEKVAKINAKAKKYGIDTSNTTALKQLEMSQKRLDQELKVAEESNANKLDVERVRGENEADKEYWVLMYGKALATPSKDKVTGVVTPVKVNSVDDVKAAAQAADEALAKRRKEREAARKAQADAGGGSGDPVKISTKEEYDKLPSGAQWIDAQGNVRQKR